MKVTIRKALGCYNLVRPRESSWSVSLSVEGVGGTSQGWPEDDEPDVDGLPPSEVVDLLEGREARLLLNSSRERDRAFFASVRERAESIDAAWAAQEAERMEREAQRLIQQAALLSRRADGLRATYQVAQ